MIVIKMTTAWGTVDIHVGSKVSALRNIQKFPQTLFPGTTSPVMSRKVSVESVEKVPNSVWFQNVPGAFFFLEPGVIRTTKPIRTTNIYPVGFYQPLLQVDPASILRPPFRRAAMLQQVLDSTARCFFGDVFGPGFWHQSWLKIHLNHLGFSVEKIAVLLKFRLFQVVEGQGFTPGPCRFWTMGNPNGKPIRTTTSELWNHWEWMFTDFRTGFFLTGLDAIQQKYRL